jgi:hypothetical protein
MGNLSRNLIVAIAMLGAGIALGPCAGAQSPDSRTEPPTLQPPPVVPPSPSDPETPNSLSHQLDNSQGVIKPDAHIDREMVKPAPDVGSQSMPVIPPPGTPDNNPDLRPR